MIAFAQSRGNRIAGISADRMAAPGSSAAPEHSAAAAGESVSSAGQSAAKVSTAPKSSTAPGRADSPEVLSLLPRSEPFTVAAWNGRHSVELIHFEPGLAIVAFDAESFAGIPAAASIVVDDTVPGRFLVATVKNLNLETVATAEICRESFKVWFDDATGGINSEWSPLPIVEAVALYFQSAAGKSFRNGRNRHNGRNNRR